MDQVQCNAIIYAYFVKWLFSKTIYPLWDKAKPKLKSGSFIWPKVKEHAAHGSDYTCKKLEPKLPGLTLSCLKLKNFPSQFSSNFPSLSFKDVAVQLVARRDQIISPALPGISTLAIFSL